MITSDDFRRVRWALLGALAMAALGAAILFLTHRATQQARIEARQSEARLRESAGKLKQARDEQSEIASRIGRFGELAQSGVIGEERRLEWIERIKAIRAARKLYDMQYEIVPQRPLAATVAPGESGNFEFLASSMKLSMDLLHEEDLLNFLDDLSRTPGAFVRPESCTLERTGTSENTGKYVVGPQLRATCVVDWITIRERKDQG